MPPVGLEVILAGEGGKIEWLSEVLSTGRGQGGGVWFPCRDYLRIVNDMRNRVFWMFRAREAETRRKKRRAYMHSRGEGGKGKEGTDDAAYELIQVQPQGKARRERTSASARSVQ